MKLTSTPTAAGPASFVYAVCQRGAEKALKDEVARDAPTLRPAFMRPGFVTFKVDGDVDDRVRVPSVFARTWGRCLGKTTLDDVVAHARQLPEWPRLHVFQNDRYVVGEEPDGFDPRAEPLALRDQLLAHGAFLADELPEVGDVVLDVIDVDGELWLGSHIHTRDRLPHAGGHPHLVMPKDAPSRAWLKIEEALLWSHAPIHAGDKVIEVGCAPGGVTWALLNRGCQVLGIDPNDMDPRVLANRNFQHWRRSAQSVDVQRLPPGARFLVLDVNLPPRTAISQIWQIVYTQAATLEGLLLTLKLGRAELVREIPEMLARIARMGTGFPTVRAIQLPSNRSEFFVCAQKGR